MKKLYNFIKNYPYKKMFFLMTILFVGYIITYGYLTYTLLLWHNIESIIRYAFIICLTIILLVFLLSGINALIKAKKSKHIFYLFMIILFGIAQFIGASYIDKVYSSIDKMNKTEVTYSTSLIALKNSNIIKINDVKNKKIGIINDTTDMEGYAISQDIIKDNDLSKNNTLTKYDNFLSMLDDLYDKKIDLIFISTNYPSMYSSVDKFENIKAETKTVITKTKTVAKTSDSTSTSVSRIEKPFTILLMGVDSDLNNISSGSFNGDSLMLLTFNPTTLNTTILSIPRDTFVPIACFKNQDQSKITHAAWQGASCMIRTIQNLTDIKIDYYIKINFKGVVSLVDTLGGIYMDIPYNFCEQNSNRAWGKSTIYVKKGYQKLDGEKALAYSRNRHANPQCGKSWSDYVISDIDRGQHQQQVVSAIFDKLKDVRDVNQMYNILDLIEKNVDTNLTTNQILSFYNVGKMIINSSKINRNIIDFQKLYLSTHGMYPYPIDEGAIEIYDEGSLEDITKAMKINLGVSKATLIKEFSFSINNPYVPKIIGKGNYQKTILELVPDFTKHTKQWATDWGADNGILIKFNATNSSNSNYIQDQIINQSVKYKTLAVNVNKTTGITLTTVNKVAPAKINCSLEENEDNDLCFFPTSVGDKYSSLLSWENKIIISGFIITPKEVSTNDESKNGIIKSQTKNETDGDDVIKGTKVTDLPSEIIIQYYKYESGPTEGD